MNSPLMYKRFDLIHNGVIVDMITFEEPENYAKMPYAVKSLFCNIWRPLAYRLAHLSLAHSEPLLLIFGFRGTNLSVKYISNVTENT